jgi:pimeloyl-ACP methyl ester carboxylesterase
MSWAILYLHGVGQQVRHDAWHQALASSLEGHGIDPPSLTSPRMICPDYVDLLKLPPSQRVDEPDETPKAPGTKSERLTLRAAYARGQREAIEGLPDLTKSLGLAGLGQQVDPDLAAHLKRDLRDAAMYLANKSLRAAILHRVIHDIGRQRDLIVLGHSLGSLVAIDLLAHLPAQLRIRRLITLGSPAGNLSTMRKRPDALLRDFPFHRVDGWFNAFNPWDLVPRGLGLAPNFPAACDLRIDMGAAPVHSAARHLRHPAVTKLIADAIRPTITSTTEPGSALDIPLTAQEDDAVDTLLFAQLVATAIRSDERKERYREAIRSVQIEVSRELIDNRLNEGRPLPVALTALRSGDLDGSRFSSRSMDAQLLFAVISATNNPIAPYEIEVEKEQRSAVEKLWCDAYGYTPADARVVVRSIAAAEGAFGISWGKYAIGAAGLALLAAGPVGLLLVAPAGLAGAAAITSALAAFGPGGMVGGMALAGSLVGVGSGTVALSATLPSGMSADMVRTQCVRVMSFALAQRDLAIPGPTHNGWHLLVSWDSSLSAERERLAALSDDDSHGIKSIDANLKIIRRAIAWMVDRRLAPALPSDDD